MFVDELEMLVRGGRGGNGVVSFRREKYVPRGGPDGGDGGDGGHVYLLADSSKHSFLDLRYRHIYKAVDGSHGSNQNRHGSRGNDLYVMVPPGTLVYDEQKNILADLTKSGQKVIAARGGKGGRGNVRFSSSRNRVPRLAEKGLPGVERIIKLELKLMAQVGLVGFPNAGKSTLLSRITEARPKVASYPFTTLTPHLGVVRVNEYGSFVVADLPGLIEGAHQGAGLGHQFLKHVERNLMLLFLIDLSPDSDPEPVQVYHLLKKEISAYNPQLTEYPRIVVGNKLDLPGTKEQLTLLEQSVQIEDSDQTAVIGISAVTGEGLDELVRFLYDRITRLKEEKKEAPDDEEVIKLKHDEYLPLKIKKTADLFVVEGSDIERMAALTDFDNEAALRRFQSYCRRSGLENELKKKGIKEGDTVRIGKDEFIYYE